jgi:hypothetical protein
VSGMPDRMDDLGLSAAGEFDLFSWRTSPMRLWRENGMRLCNEVLRKTVFHGLHKAELTRHVPENEPGIALGRPGP